MVTILELKRVEKILDILGNPHKDLKCIHIAGTNGKRFYNIYDYVYTNRIRI